MSILVYPLIDTLRVFILRILQGNSPFKADKNHIHHKFEKMGIGHRKTALTLFFFNIVVVLFQLFIQIILKIQTSVAQSLALHQLI
mgnify:CR=1 FL=1